MKQSLYERYFPVEEERVTQSVMDEWVGIRERLSSLVSSAGWPELKARLDALIDRSEVRPGEEKDMLFQVGRREALREVRDLFRQMEQELRHERGT